MVVDKPLLLTPLQVAVLLQVDRHVVYGLMHSGQLPFLPLGERRLRIPLRAVEEWIERASIQKGATG